MSESVTRAPDVCPFCDRGRVAVAPDGTLQCLSFECGVWFEEADAGHFRELTAKDYELDPTRPDDSELVARP